MWRSRYFRLSKMWCCTLYNYSYTSSYSVWTVILCELFCENCNVWMLKAFRLPVKIFFFFFSKMYFFGPPTLEWYQKLSSKNQFYAKYKISIIKVRRDRHANRHTVFLFYYKYRQTICKIMDLKFELNRHLLSLNI